MRILVAEDESLVAMGLSYQLSRLGHTVVASARTAEVAVHMAERLRPELVIMDVRMPEMGGVEAAKKILKKLATPVILITGFPNETLRSQSQALGLVCLAKPVGDTELSRAISDLGVPRGGVETAS